MVGPLRAIACALLALALCAPAAAGDRLRVAASFTILADLARTVAGDDAAVRTLTPVGAEVHEWELTARNFVTLEQTDLVLHNGYGLEQWMAQVRATVAEGTPVVAVAEATEYPTRAIVTGDLQGDPDPHLWMDPRAAAAYLEVIAEAMAERDPDRAEGYHRRAAEGAERLQALHEALTETLAAIPAENRTLITSEAAFLYFADAYDFHHTGIWGSNAEEEGTPRQMARVTDLVRDRQPPALFWESTISDRYVRGLSRDTGIPVAGPLYVDSLSGTDGAAPDYAALMRHNAGLLVEHLGP